MKNSPPHHGPSGTDSAIYRRVSTGNQDSSLIVQEADNDRYNQNLGFRVVHSIEDDDTSAMIPMARRKGGAQLISLLQQGGIKHLITSAQDRMGRDTLDQITTIRFVWDLGITPHFVSEGGALPRTPHNVFLFEMKASFSQLERNMIAGRIQRSMDYKFDRTELTGNVPFGYDCDYCFRDGHRETVVVARSEKDPLIILLMATHGPIVKRQLVDNVREQDWIRQMHAWRAGKMTLRGIATRLNKEGIATKTPAGQDVVRWLKQNGQKVRHVIGQTSGLWQAANVDSVLKSRYTSRLLDGARPGENAGDESQAA